MVHQLHLHRWDCHFARGDEDLPGLLLTQHSGGQGWECPGVARAGGGPQVARVGKDKY